MISKTGAMTRCRRWNSGLHPGAQEETLGNLFRCLLDPEVGPGIGRALATITLGEGVQGETEAIEILCSLKFFADQSVTILTGVARLLHERYPLREFTGGQQTC